MAQTHPHPHPHPQSHPPSLSLSFNINTNTYPHSSRSPSPTSSIFSSSSSLTMASSTSHDELEDHYFSSNPPPKALPHHESLARAFIAQHAAAGRRVVLVTSGGTTVPLERNTVRFIDNFSAGTRGATSAEYFLESGYGVIFLHRQFSLQPYSRHYSHATDCFLDFMREDDRGAVVVSPEHQDKMLAVLRKYNAAKDRGLLLTIPFVTITDYLHELRAIASLMRPLGPSGLLYLAAAVSDFFVPPERMAEHKIQSTTATDRLQAVADDEAFDNFDSSPAVPRSKRLVVDLDPVPKFLKNLVDGWAPNQMIVSFKLETDPAILVHKARYSLDRYQHHLVVGNLLSTRKWEVVFVSPGRPDKWVRVPAVATHPSSSGSVPAEDKPLDPATLPEGDPDVEIESLIIPAIEDLHDHHISSYEQRQESPRQGATS